MTPMCVSAVVFADDRHRRTSVEMDREGSMSQGIRRSWDVFASYSHRDKEFVRPFVRELEQALDGRGVTIYLDAADEPTKHQEGLAVGLSEGLANSCVLVAFVSEAYLTSKWCAAEAAWFLRQQMATAQRPELAVVPADLLKNCGAFIPVVIDAEDDSEVVRKTHMLLSILKLTHGVKVSLAQLSAMDRRWGRDALREILVDKLEATLNALDRHQEKLKAAQREHFDVETPESLWSVLLDQYPYENVARKVDIKSILANYSPPDPAKIPSELTGELANNAIYSLLEGIASGAATVRVFDETSATEMTQRNLIPALQDDFTLAPWQHMGSPVAALMFLSKKRPIAREAQYSYYQFLQSHPRSPLVDVSVMAAIFVSAEMWDAVLPKVEDFEKYVVGPLGSGEDIAENWLL